MNIVFFGNPDFAAKSLEYLNDFDDVNILSVVTNSDKKMGRGRKLNSTSVKLKAQLLGNKIIEIDNLNSVKTKNILKSLNADLFIVVAYKILPEIIYSLPKFGSINLHPSLLPKYQGPSPIQYTLLNGDKETGLTSFKINDKVDQGDIIYQKQISINNDITYEELLLKFLLITKDVLRKTIDLIVDNNYIFKSQDNSSSSFKAPKIKREDLMINWKSSSKAIHNQIRALSYIGVYTYHNNKRVKLYSSSFSSNNKSNIQPSEGIYDENNLIIGTGNGLLYIKELQIEGSRRIKAKDFINSIKTYKFKFN